MRSETILRATRREACDDAIRHTRRNSRAIAIPAASARNESSAITGTGGHGLLAATHAHGLGLRRHVHAGMGMVSAACHGR